MNGYEKSVQLVEEDEDQRTLLGSVADNVEHNDPLTSDDAKRWRKATIGNLVLWWCPINGLPLIMLEPAHFMADAHDSTVG